MFTFTCVFVHCFLRACEMYSQSLVSPQILLPHISFNTKTRVKKPTTNDVNLPGLYRAFKGVLDNGAGFEVPTCTNRMAEKISSIKTHHVPYTLILCASAPSLRTGCLLSSECHCTLSTRQGRTKTHSWLVHGPSTCLDSDPPPHTTATLAIN